MNAKKTAQSQPWPAPPYERIWINLTAHGSAVVIHLITWAGIAGCVYFGTDAAKEFAGKDTNTRVNIDALASLAANQWFAWMVAALTTGWATLERRLRREHTHRHEEHKRDIEKRIDPGRSTSRLNKDGSTRREDLP